MKHIEDAIQKDIVKYLHLQYPDALFTAIPGGMFSSPSQGAKMKAMGYRPGTPDLFILEPRKGRHALIIELKKPDGIPQDNQLIFNDLLDMRGYEAWICYGFEHAKEVIDDYLRSKL